MSYGWMGRTPDYKASLMNTLGVQYDFYEKFADNAKAWYRRAQDNVLFMNHAIVNPPVDRNKAADQVRDVFITIQKETDAGCLRVRRQGGGDLIGDHALQFPRPERRDAGERSRPRDHVHRADECAGREAVLPRLLRDDGERDGHAVTTIRCPRASTRTTRSSCSTTCFIPWEDILIYRDVEKLKTFYPRSGFVNGFQFQGCTRLAVKLDFLAGVVAKALRVTGADEFRGNQAMLGEIIAWRNLFWAISDAMAMNPVPWSGGAVLPNAQSGSSYRVFAGDAYRRVQGDRREDHRVGADLSAVLGEGFRESRDRQVSGEIRARLEQHRLSRAHQDHEAVVGRGRHRVRRSARALRDQLCRQPRGHPHPGAVQRALEPGTYDKMVALADACMADYDEKGWTGDTWLNPDDVAYPGVPGTAKAAE